ncbi:AfsR/SARP family transcriptional regulator [Kitasatospora griseola]|uniref:AfsR/SARP family transcriptional regulator n=1 Tax=Kitasatospora griseola TaxID=2064 RepID=UPI0036630222
MVRITVLGALTAQVAGDAVRLGGPRQRAVLARLLVARGAAVSAERLIDDLWDGDPPAKAAVSLQAYVSNLRRLLEPARGPRQESRLLVSAGRGYALREVDVDAAEFETLTTRVNRRSRSRCGRAPRTGSSPTGRGPSPRPPTTSGTPPRSPAAGSRRAGRPRPARRSARWTADARSPPQRHLEDRHARAKWTPRRLSHTGVRQ